MCWDKFFGAADVVRTGVIRHDTLRIGWADKVWGVEVGCVRECSGEADKVWLGAE